MMLTAMGKINLGQNVTLHIQQMFNNKFIRNLQKKNKSNLVIKILLRFLVIFCLFVIVIALNILLRCLMVLRDSYLYRSHYLPLNIHSRDYICNHSQSLCRHWLHRPSRHLGNGRSLSMGSDLKKNIG